MQVEIIDMMITMVHLDICDDGDDIMTITVIMQLQLCVKHRQLGLLSPPGRQDGSSLMFLPALRTLSVSLTFHSFHKTSLRYYGLCTMYECCNAPRAKNVNKCTKLHKKK